MLQRLCRGFNSKSFRDTLYFYLIGVVTIAPIIGLVILLGDRSWAFRMIPILAALFVLGVATISLSQVSRLGRRSRLRMSGIAVKFQGKNYLTKKRP